jgi:hypothetical protein
MKKITTIVSVLAIAAVTFVSCSKKGNYTCTCTIAVGGVSTTQAIPFTDYKKSDAQKACTNAEAADNATVPGSTTCTFN